MKDFIFRDTKKPIKVGDTIFSWGVAGNTIVKHCEIVEKIESSLKGVYFSIDSRDVETKISRCYGGLRNESFVSSMHAMDLEIFIDSLKEKIINKVRLIESEDSLKGILEYIEDYCSLED
jgi:hypothetical protein